MFSAFSPWHLLILVGVIALLFGPSQVPKLARTVGKSVKEVKDQLDEVNPATAVRKQLAELNPLHDPEAEREKRKA